MTMTFLEHLDLLRLHGRAAVASLGQLPRDAPVPPRGDSAQRTAEEYWGTLEIWAWSLENLNLHWSQRADPEKPRSYSPLVARIAAELGRLETSLLGLGGDAGVDYFGRAGTTAEVARLLAHEAIAVAHAATLTAGRTAPALHPAAASDGIDQALRHWASSATDVVWQPETVAVRYIDTDDSWHLAVGRGTDSPEGELCLVEPTSPAAVVEGPADKVLWWLHGHTTPEDAVGISGAPETIRGLRSALLHPVQQKPRRRRRWFG